MKKAFESLTGGSAVAVIGLSQILAVGALSFTPLGAEILAAGVVAAFISATIGGLCVALIARAPGEVAGPRTSISVIYAALCADLIARGETVSAPDVLAGLSLAVVLMGALQILAGVIRLGDVMKFLPYPVNAGFVTGIGLLIVWSQLGPILGLEGRLANYSWSELVEGFKPAALIVGLITAALVWIIPGLTKRVQPLLASLVIGTVAYHVAAPFIGNEAVGPTLGTIAPYAAAKNNFLTAWGRADLVWLLDTTVTVLPYAAFLALQGIMNAALTSVAVADITGLRPQVNRTLIAQGVANMLCGALAGLPVGSSPSQSNVAAKMRSVNHVVPAMSCVVLFVGLIVFGSLLAYVPLVVLAALLITTGVGLIDRWTRGLLVRVIRGHDIDGRLSWNLAIVAAVAAAFFVGSVPLALLVGAVLAMILLAVSLSSATTILAVDGTSLPSRRVWPSAQAQWLSSARAVVRIMRPRGGLFFGTADHVADELAKLDKRFRFCIIDFSRLTTVDATGCQIVSASAKRLAARDVTVLLAGLHADNSRDRSLVDLGLAFPVAASHWFRDLDHAMEWVEAALLRDRWPEIAADAPVALTEASLTQGLTETELSALRGYLKPADLEPGVKLFERGGAGSSIYLIDSGLIDIRVATDGANGGWRRMAVLGPGCIFGEVAMLTHGERSADAICIKPARLLELRRESLLSLERHFPAAYVKIVANLGVHLAIRLMAATEVVRAD